ncbi:MAG: hypothetical protein CMJ89_18690 [Planctomycetes bacterium]|nr:hypothetical protein [Planctomycetota bacterium]
MRAIRIPALFVVLVLGACRGPRLYSSKPGPYDRIPEGWEAPLVEARRHLEQDEPVRAHRILVELTTENPRILPVRILLQEVELQLLKEGLRAGNLSVPSPDRSLMWLGDHYLTQAEANPTTEAYVLAARLVPATDPARALAFLDQAEALDPKCVWIPYARAWWNFVDYRFTPAENAVRDAFRLDSGHLPTMRLHAIVLTAAGETAGAIKVLKIWWKRSRNDPLVSPEERGEALLDLASLKVLVGKPKEALRHLDDVDPRVFENLARLDQVRAAAYEGRNRFDLAFEEVRRAEDYAPEDPLPIVHEAMLHARQGDEEDELLSWQRLLDHLGEHESDGFSALLFKLQAITRLQRAAEAGTLAEGGEAVPRP